MRRKVALDVLAGGPEGRSGLAIGLIEETEELPAFPQHQGHHPGVLTRQFYGNGAEAGVFHHQVEVAGEFVSQGEQIPLQRGERQGPLPAP